MPPAVSLHNVAKHYAHGRQRLEVLEGLELEVEAGEFVALTGPSGSGKTTLLNLVAGLARADQGSVRVAGEALEQLGSAQLAHWRAKNIGFVAQLQKLSPWLTAEQNVELPLLLGSLSRAQRASDVRAALQFVGMEERGSCAPSELSGGEQQRVAIARALVADPALLLCDEPTDALDPQTAARILDLLELVNRALGTTMVMVTHDPQAMRRASRQLQMGGGRLRAAGQAA